MVQTVESQRKEKNTLKTFEQNSSGFFKPVFFHATTTVSLQQSSVYVLAVNNDGCEWIVNIYNQQEPSGAFCDLRLPQIVTAAAFPQ